MRLGHPAPECSPSLPTQRLLACTPTHRHRAASHPKDQCDGGPPSHLPPPHPSHTHARAPPARSLCHDSCPVLPPPSGSRSTASKRGCPGAAAWHAPCAESRWAHTLDCLQALVRVCVQACMHLPTEGPVPLAVIARPHALGLATYMSHAPALHVVLPCCNQLVDAAANHGRVRLPAAMLLGVCMDMRVRPSMAMPRPSRLCPRARGWAECPQHSHPAPRPALDGQALQPWGVPVYTIRPHAAASPPPGSAPMDTARHAHHVHSHPRANEYNASVRLPLLRHDSCGSGVL